MKYLSAAILALVAVLLLFSCADDEVNPTKGEPSNSSSMLVDSIQFVKDHHYWIDDNFVAGEKAYLTEDVNAMRGADGAEFICDSLIVVEKGTEIAVADIYCNPVDSNKTLWLMLVVNGEAWRGWISEPDFLKMAVPISPISRTLYWLSAHKMLLLIGFGLFTLLWIVVALLSMRPLGAERTKMLFVPQVFFVRSMETKVPRRLFYMTLACGMWTIFLFSSRMVGHVAPALADHFYFHPTLNFFHQDLSWIRLCLLLGWLTLILSVCAVLEAIRTQAWRRAAFQLVRFLWIIVGVYLMMVLLPSVWAVTVFTAVWLALLVWYGWHLRNFRYMCGYCGREITHLGVCPHCGKKNV